MPFPSETTYPSEHLYPGSSSEFAPISWDNHDERYYQTGVDRGVLYPDGKDPVAFNGITGVTEEGEATSSILYRDGRIYLADMEPGDFQGTLTAFMFPDAFSACVGIPEVADGLYVDNQRPRRFSLAYRSLIGSGAKGDMFGYQIHLIYNAMASIGTRNRRTLSDTPSPMEFTFSLVCTPVQLPGFRPSAHYIIDTRHLESETVAQLEAILYGDGATPGRMPTPTELYDILNFGSRITFTTFNHPSLGVCWRATGSYTNVHMTSDTTWVIRNVNGINYGDGTYKLEDTL